MPDFAGSAAIVAVATVLSICDIGTARAETPAAARRVQKPAAGEVRVVFMGVSTLLVEDDTTQILLDGFFTRPSVWSVKFGKLKPDPVKIREGLCRGGVDRPVAVLTAHGHYDHAMDAAEIVAERGGVLVGSASVANIGRGRNLRADQLETIENRASWRIGCFQVTAFPAPHASPDRWEGDIEQKLTPAAKASSYRNGGSYSYLFERAGLRILVHPSAGSRPGLYQDVSADIVFLGIGGLGIKDSQATQALWSEAVTRTHATRVFPIHWDNFTRPLDRKLKPAPWPLDRVGVTQARLNKMAQATGGRIAVTMPTVFESIRFTSDAPGISCAATDATKLERLG